MFDKIVIRKLLIKQQENHNKNLTDWSAPER